MQNATQSTATAAKAPTQPARKVRKAAQQLTPKTARLLAYLAKNGHTSAKQPCTRKVLQNTTANAGTHFGKKGYALWLGTLTNPAPGTVAGQGLIKQLPGTGQGMYITPHGMAVLAHYRTLQA